MSAVPLFSLKRALNRREREITGQQGRPFEALHLGSESQGNSAVAGGWGQGGTEPRCQTSQSRSKPTQLPCPWPGNRKKPSCVGTQLTLQECLYYRRGPGDIAGQVSYVVSLCPSLSGTQAKKYCHDNSVHCSTDPC